MDKRTITLEEDRVPTLVLVHVPKTGGTSVAASLARLFPADAVQGFYDALPDAGAGFGSARLVASHARLVDLARVDPAARFVATLRRPIERIVSIYRFWTSIRVEECIASGRPHLLETKEMTFESFVLAPPAGAMLDNEIVRQFADVPEDRSCNHADLEAAKAGLSRCAAILRTETLDEDLRELFARIGCESLFELSRVNVTDANPLREPSRFEEAAAVDLAKISNNAARALHALTYLDAQLGDWAASRIGALRTAPLAIPIERPTLQRGETLRPCRDRRFLSLLVHGWSDVDTDGALWSVGREASLAFRIPASGMASRLRLTIAPCLVSGRSHMRVKIASGTQSSSVLCLHPNADLAGDVAFGGDHPDRICVVSRPIEIDVAIDAGLHGDHVVDLKLPPLSSPMMLGYNGDDRALGVRLVSLELV